MQKFDYEKPLIEIFFRPLDEADVLGDVAGLPSSGGGGGSGFGDGDDIFG